MRHEEAQDPGPNRNAVASRSPGLPRGTRGYLGSPHHPCGPTLKGLCHRGGWQHPVAQNVPAAACPGRTQPRWGCGGVGARCPGVAAGTPQPRAGGRNPVGVRGAQAPRSPLIPSRPWRETRISPGRAAYVESAACMNSSQVEKNHACIRGRRAAANVARRMGKDLPGRSCNFSSAYAPAFHSKFGGPAAAPVRFILHSRRVAC